MESWLETLSLGQYTDVFVGNDIALDDLRDLTEDDLKELGLSLGHRKRLLRAVAELATPAATNSAIAQDSATSWSRQAGERKPVTLLFADITGSTLLTEALDAEDAHERLYGVVQLMCESIEAERGTVCRFMGDGVMAMFGAPLAYEDHPRRACAAALALQNRITDYADDLEREHGCRIQVRVGLHSGEVVVLPVGSANKAEYDASGASVPLAARMEQTAQPGTIQMTASTFALVESHFEGEALQPVLAKGFDEPVPAVRLLRRRAVNGATMAAPFVERCAEMEQLRALFDACSRERSGRCVVLRGEPGIGKSRLAERAIGEAPWLPDSSLRCTRFWLGSGSGCGATAVARFTRYWR